MVRQTLDARAGSLQATGEDRGEESLVGLGRVVDLDALSHWQLLAFLELGEQFLALEAVGTKRRDRVHAERGRDCMCTAKCGCNTHK